MENLGHPQGNATCKKLRLFGFDLNYGENNANNLSDDHHTHDQMLGKRKCPFCDKEFTNSQALGGHQNAHKKERMMRRKSELEERKASIEFYLQSIDQQSSNFLVYNSPTYGYYPFTSSYMNENQFLVSPIPYPDDCERPGLSALQVYVPY